MEEVVQGLQTTAAARVLPVEELKLKDTRVSVTLAPVRVIGMEAAHLAQVTTIGREAVLSPPSNWQGGGGGAGPSNWQGGGAGPNGWQGQGGGVGYNHNNFNNWNENSNGGGGFDSRAYDYGNGQGHGNAFARGGFNGGGRGYQTADNNGGQQFFNTEARDGFNGNFHPGSGGETYDNRNRRRPEYRPHGMGGHFAGRGNGKGRSHERYVEMSKPVDKSVRVSGVVIPGTVSDAEVTKAVTGAISVVGVQQVTRGQPVNNETPMRVTMEPVASLVTTTDGSALAATDATGNVVLKKNKKKEKNADKVKCFRCGNVGHYSIECKFPSKMELTRATRFGTFLAKEDSKCFVKITEWKSEVKPKLRLDEVWILISGVPEGLLRDYLALWGLCGMIGKTIAVDIAYTRRHEVVRAHVRVTDISMIPFHRIITYKGDGYELSFEIEMDKEMLAADGGDDGDHGDDGDNAGDDKGMDSNSKSREDRDSGKSLEKKDKEPVTKAGVILPSSITETLLLTPAMKFGSFSDRWSDLDDDEENTSRCLFFSLENESFSGGHAGITHMEQPEVAVYSDIADKSPPSVDLVPIAAAAAFSPVIAAVAVGSPVSAAAAQPAATITVTAENSNDCAAAPVSSPLVCKTVATNVVAAAGRSSSAGVGVGMHRSHISPLPSLAPLTPCDGRSVEVMVGSAAATPPATPPGSATSAALGKAQHKR
ncbi:hypothetical protein ACQ4PT_003075 [Festuca glaucescens]